MKKLAIVAFGAICAPVLLATSALAESNLHLPSRAPPQAASVVRRGGRAASEALGRSWERGGVAPGAQAGALAFTGTQITVWMVAAAALLLLGVGLLVAARQRAKRARP